VIFLSTEPPGLLTLTRIKAAGAAFASSSKRFFALKDIAPEHKGRNGIIIESSKFTSLITFVLAWALSAAALHRLQMFHIASLGNVSQSMCPLHVTRQNHKMAFSTLPADLERRIGIKSFDH
jgi:hypothetical protein